MDEKRTRQTLDALGDIFLTEALKREQRAASEDADGAPKSRHAANTKSGAAGAHGSAGVDILHAPKPFRLPPKVRPVVIDAQSLHPAAGRKAPLTGTESIGKAGAAATAEADPLELPGHLRLVRDDEHAAAAVPQAPPTVEAVFLGNLPGFGGPWLAQYAHHVANDTGRPVAILHVDDEQIDMDIVGTPRHREELFVLRKRLSAPVSEGLLPRLESIFDHGTCAIGAWLIHLSGDIGKSPAEGAGKQLVAIARQLRQWTFLTGVDHMALRAVHQSLSEMLSATGATRKPQVAVMMMGADSDRIPDAIATLNGLVSDLTGNPVELAGSRKQMVPVNVEPIGSFALTGELWDGLAALLLGDEGADHGLSLNAIDTAGAEDDNRTAASAEALLNPPAEASDVADDDDVQIYVVDDELEMLTQPLPVAAPMPEVVITAGQTKPQPQPAADTPDVAPSEAMAQPSTTASSSSSSLAEFISRLKTTIPAPADAPDAANARQPHEQEQEPTIAADVKAVHQPQAAPEASAQTAPSPAPAPAPQPTAQPQPAPMRPTSAAAAAELDLSQFLAGSLRLAARCPRQPGTQIVLDEAGRLHLLRRHTVTNAGESIQQACLNLFEASAWVREHLELLCMTQRQLRFDTAAEPTMHLFTDDARSAVALARQLPAPLKLHLLQSAGPASAPSWFSTELT